MNLDNLHTWSYSYGIILLSGPRHQILDCYVVPKFACRVNGAILFSLK